MIYSCTMNLIDKGLIAVCLSDVFRSLIPSCSFPNPKEIHIGQLFDQKRVLRNLGNTHESTQLFMLISSLFSYKPHSLLLRRRTVLSWLLHRYQTPIHKSFIALKIESMISVLFLGIWRYLLPESVFQSKIFIMSAIFASRVHRHQNTIKRDEYKMRELQFCRFNFRTERNIHSWRNHSEKILSARSPL